MTHSEHPLARRTIIKGIGLGVAAGMSGARPAPAATAGGIGRRRHLE